MVDKYTKKMTVSECALKIIIFLGCFLHIPDNFRHVLIL